MGAKWIHMVDIDGAFKGKSKPQYICRHKEKFNCFCKLVGESEPLKLSSSYKQ